MVLLLAAAVAFSTACSKPAKDASAEVTPTPEQRKTVEAFGTIEVNEIRNINLDFDAVVEEIAVKEGQQVKKGDTLVVLDMKGYMEQIERKAHELNITRLEADKLSGNMIEEQLENNNDPDIKKLVNDLNYANDVLSKAIKEQVPRRSCWIPVRFPGMNMMSS
jgi:multidrug efflux pump subunit AcrA (membrane-fusion protein)